jgi:choline dehydrogenase-like flavoprotein
MDRTRIAPVAERHRKVIVVGSGFGGAFAAIPLVERGHDVLMVERGRRVTRGPENWEERGTIMRSSTYADGPTFTARTDRGTAAVRGYACVGGPSVHYGGVSLRFRESDFDPGPEIVGASGAAWPISYRDLAPWYDRVERVLTIAGRAGEDPTEPPRGHPYPMGPDSLSEVSRVVAEAARSLGLQPFRLPLAINHEPREGRGTCVRCATCDTFPCAVEAKNDVEVSVLRNLEAAGLELWSETTATGVLVEKGRVIGVELLRRGESQRTTVTADRVILAGGALATPHLLLASDLHEANPAGDLVGRYLTRHCSGIVFGLYGWLIRYEGRFHKQIGIHDYYEGHPGGVGPLGPLGSIQQSHTPALATIRGELNGLTTRIVAPLSRRATGLLVMGHDRPRYENRITLSPTETDENGLPRMEVDHRYDGRDVAARRFLAGRARAIHRAAGARVSYTHTIDTFSHALGTVRMGTNATTSPLDPKGRFRGVAGLYVSDGSALPTAAGVNPSLTIAANALRVSEGLVGDLEAAS